MIAISSETVTMSFDAATKLIGRNPSTAPLSTSKPFGANSGANNDLRVAWWASLPSGAIRVQAIIHRSVGERISSDLHTAGGARCTWLRAEINTRDRTQSR